MSSGLKITKTRKSASRYGTGVAAPDYDGPPALLITGISQEVYDLIGEKMLWVDDRVTVIAPDLSDSRGESLLVDLDGGDPFSVPISHLTPIPKTRTVTLEVSADVDPRTLEVWRRGQEPYSVAAIEQRITHIDGEEVEP